MTPDISHAVIDEAHKRGLRVAAHVYYLADAKDLIAAGVDFIAHSVRDQKVDTEFVTALKASGRCYTPTLMREVSTYVYESTPDFFSDPPSSHANRLGGRRSIPPGNKRRARARPRRPIRRSCRSPS
jgi:hypothetical protein